MAETKARKNATSRTTRGKSADSKSQSSAQGKTRKMPSKAALRQMAKDWDHVT